MGDYYLVDFETGVILEKAKLSKRVLEMEESVTLASGYQEQKKLKAEGKDVLSLTLESTDFIL